MAALSVALCSDMAVFAAATRPFASCWRMANLSVHLPVASNWASAALVASLCASCASRAFPSASCSLRPRAWYQSALAPAPWNSAFTRETAVAHASLADLRA